MISEKEEFEPKDIAHRSLRPCDIYLDEFLTQKIGDFGLSTRFSSPESVTLESIMEIKATPVYSSPEELEFNKFRKQNDFYSFTMISYEKMNKKIPFNELLLTKEIVQKLKSI